MCDAASFFSAGTSLANGIIQSGASRDAANFTMAMDGANQQRANITKMAIGNNKDFQLAQLDVMKTLISASGSQQDTSLMQDHIEGQKKNAAAAALSGLSGASFSAVRKGNTDHLRADLAKVAEATRQKLGQIDLKKLGVKFDAQGQITQVDQQALNAHFDALQKSAALRAKASAALWSGIGDAVDTLGQAETKYEKYNTGQTRMQSFFTSLHKPVNWSKAKN